METSVGHLFLLQVLLYLKKLFSVTFPASFRTAFSLDSSLVWTNLDLFILHRLCFITVQCSHETAEKKLY